MAAAWLAAILEAAASRGIATTPLLAGLSIEGRALAGSRTRIPWDDCAVVLDRLSEATGGPTGVEAIAESLIVSSPFFATLAVRLLSLRRLVQVGLERVGSAVHRHTGSRLALSPDGRAEFTYRIDDRYRGSVPFGYGTLASLRTYPRLLGLPDLVVSARIGSHAASYTFQLPPERTLPARAVRRVRRRLAALLSSPAAIGDHSATALATDVSDELIEEGLGDACATIGQRLAGHESLGALLGDFDAVARERYLARRVAVKVVGREAALAWDRERARPVPDAAKDGAVLLPLVFAGREIGRIELDADAAVDPQAGELSRLSPWLALGLASCLAREDSRRPSPVAPLALATAAWSLTPRESRVLHLVAEGLANKEVANELACSVKNVEAALTRLLRKAGVGSRAALVRGVWSARQALTPPGGGAA